MAAGWEKSRDLVLMADGRIYFDILAIESRRKKREVRTQLRDGWKRWERTGRLKAGVSLS